MPRTEGGVPWRNMPEEWEAYAACANSGTDRWFDEENPADARAVCSTCPVNDPCLEFAIRGGTSLYGIWAGTTHEDRKRILRARRRGVA